MKKCWPNTAFYIQQFDYMEWVQPQNHQDLHYPDSHNRNFRTWGRSRGQVDRQPDYWQLDEYEEKKNNL